MCLLLTLNRQLPAGKIFPIQLQCNYDTCVIYNRDNYIIISHYNISVVTMKIILLFFQNTANRTKLQTRLNFLNPCPFKYKTPHSFHPSPLSPFSDKNFSLPSPTQSYLEKLMKVGVYRVYRGIQGLLRKLKEIPVLFTTLRVYASMQKTVKSFFLNISIIRSIIMLNFVFCLLVSKTKTKQKTMKFK